MGTFPFPLSTLFGRTLKFLTDEFEKLLDQNDIKLSIVEFVLLYRLSTFNEDAISQQNFANFEGKHKSVMLRQIDGLVSKNLVARLADPDDGRKYNIVPTKAGLDILA
jgi:DNA-binding MarR family transcriptional regulator